MIKIVVDSGSSIKQTEIKKYDVDILPLKILMGEKEYLDGVDLSIDQFYAEFLKTKKMPKTSLPSLEMAQEIVEKHTKSGDDVIFLTISSGISGSCNAMKLLFQDNPHVRVIDTKLAVGGIRLLVEEANKYRNESLDFVEEKINALIPKIKILAIPEKLDYLLKGGRLCPLGWLIGTMLQLKPIITFKNGKVIAETKKLGLKSAMQYICQEVEKLGVDTNYSIVASYTYKDDNLKKLIDLAGDKVPQQLQVLDNLDPAIACHWGPNAFGFIFVTK